MNRSTCITFVTVVVIGLTGFASPSWGGANSGFGRHEVVIEGLKFQPPTLTVALGDTIAWVNRDIVPHTATPDDEAWDSGNLGEGETWEFVVSSRGLFDYSCRYHPGMKATISVE